MNGALLGLIAAATAVAGGLITKAAETWLGTRSKVSEELRDQRLRFYPVIWQRTMTLSTWPRTDATYADLEHLHCDLRKWYYSGGGLYLSENARKRYGEMQELIAAHLAQPAEQAVALPDPAYADLMEACSAVRNALTEDLESRRQRSFLWTLSRWSLHRRQGRQAKKRLAVEKRLKVKRRPGVMQRLKGEKRLKVPTDAHAVRVRLEHAELEPPEKTPDVEVPSAGPPVSIG